MGRGLPCPRAHHSPQMYAAKRSLNMTLLYRSQRPKSHPRSGNQNKPPIEPFNRDPRSVLKLPVHLYIPLKVRPKTKKENQTTHGKSQEKRLAMVCTLLARWGNLNPKPETLNPTHNWNCKRLSAITWLNLGYP